MNCDSHLIVAQQPEQYLQVEAQHSCLTNLSWQLAPTFRSHHGTSEVRADFYQTLQQRYLLAMPHLGHGSTGGGQTSGSSDS